MSMKVMIGILTLGLLTGCGKEKVVYDTGGSGSSSSSGGSVPSVSVTVTTSAQGGSSAGGSAAGGSAAGGSVAGSGNSSASGGSGGSSSSTSQGGAGGSSTSQGGSSSATGGSSSANNSGSSNNNSSNNNSNSSSQTQTNSQTTNVSQSTTIDIDNQLQVIAGILGGRVYDAPSDSRGNPKCKVGEDLKTDSYGECFCVKPPKAPEVKSGLACNLYDLMATKPSKLPDFSTMTPVYSFVADQLDVADQDWAGGLPKITDASVRSKYLEWYGVRCTGSLAVAKADAYTFYLTADDGAILSLDGTKTIDNDGLHSVSTKSASVIMSQGSHSVQVDYYQGPRTRIALLLEWSSSTIARAILDKAFFSH